MQKSAGVIRVGKVTVGELKIARVTRPRVRTPLCRRERDAYSLIRKLHRELRLFREEYAAEERVQNRKIAKLERQVDRLESEVLGIPSDLSTLNKEVRKLTKDLATLQAEVAALRTAIESGVIPNPALQTSFQAKLNHIVTVSTRDGNVTGTVTLVGTDAVELRETNGDIVLIPYSKITAVL